MATATAVVETARESPSQTEHEAEHGNGTGGGPPEVWLSASQAAGVAGVDRHTIPGLAAAGVIQFQALPGKHTRYALSDCQALGARIRAGESINLRAG